MSSIFAERGQTAWAQYTKVLEDFVGPTDADTRVQALSVAEIANWDTPHANYNRYLQCRMADRLGRWAAVGSFTGRSVSSGYLEFLCAVQGEVSRTLPSAERAALEASCRRVKRLREDARNLEIEIALRWNDYRRDMDAGRVPFKSRRQFEEQQGFPVLRAQIARQVDTAQHDHDAIVHGIGGDVGAAGDSLAQYYAAENGIALPDHPEDDTPCLAAGWPILRDQGLDGDVAALKGDTRRLRMTLGDGGSESPAFAAGWDHYLGVSLPFWSISGGTAGSSYDERTSRETRSVTIALENVASFGVWRAKWYQPELLDAYGAATPGAWTRDGYLNVVPTAFILARGVTVTAAMPTDEKIYAQRTFDAGGAIRVGPFTFGGGGASATIQSTCETTSAGLKIVDTSGRALILGLTALCPSPPASRDIMGGNVDKTSNTTQDSIRSPQQRRMAER
jgi:hypothetical protein